MLQILDWNRYVFMWYEHAYVQLSIEGVQFNSSRAQKELNRCWYLFQLCRTRWVFNYFMFWLLPAACPCTWVYTQQTTKDKRTRDDDSTSTTYEQFQYFIQKQKNYNFQIIFLLYELNLNIFFIKICNNIVN